MKNIVFFTGAGISKDSGIKTFRDGDDAYWNNYKIEDVATLSGWDKDPEHVLQFYNDMHLDMVNYEPNEAHKLIASLDENHVVTVVTQNVDDLHERAGSENIYHLHGELNKKRDLKTNEIENWDVDETISIEDGYRPHVVWFGEYPYNITETNNTLNEADYLIIVGTSLEIGYVTPLLGTVNKKAKVFFINPEKIDLLSAFVPETIYIKKGAVEGLEEIIKDENL